MTDAMVEAICGTIVMLATLGFILCLIWLADR